MGHFVDDHAGAKYKVVHFFVLAPAFQEVAVEFYHPRRISTPSGFLREIKKLKSKVELSIQLGDNFFADGGIFHIIQHFFQKLPFFRR